MDENYHTRHYQAGDEDKIIELLKNSFPEWNKRENALDYWRWKYLSTPLGSNIGVATINEKIIAVDHFMTLRMKIGANVYMTQYMDDAATHPDHRGRHINSKVDDMLKADQEATGIKTLYTIPITPIMINKRNPRFVYLHKKITHVIRIRDTKRYLKQKDISNNLIGLGLETLKLRSKPAPIRRKAPENIIIEETTCFNEPIDELWREVSRGLNFAIDRDRKHLKWRYCDNRGGRFTIFQAKKDERLVGYIVAETRKVNNVEEAYIQEIVTHPDAPESAQALVESLLEKLDDLDINAVNYKAVEGHPTLKLLKKQGFIKPPIQQKMILRIVMNNLPLNLFDTVLESPSERIQFGYGDYF